MTEPALLALADGTVFHGQSVGVPGCKTGEIVFNTAVTGYQEILSDPSYAQQLITLTYPHIGNTGCNLADTEADILWASGLILRALPSVTAHWRASSTLTEFLQVREVVAIADIDTRHLTHIIRNHGAQSACLMAGIIDEEKAVELAKVCPGLQNQELASKVSTKDRYQWQQGEFHLSDSNQFIAQQYQRDALPYHLVVYDFGVKKNILRCLVEQGCYLTVVPAKTSAADVLALKPDGIVLSNGPGDPAACHYALDAINVFFQKKIPLLGICLGHQLLALASGLKTEKMKFGHHGANHPIQALKTKRVMISSQNHGFCVSDNNLPDNVVVTHRSLFDGTIQGFRRLDIPVLAVQGHPEASPGPHELKLLFNEFIEMLVKHKKLPRQFLQEQACII